MSKGLPRSLATLYDTENAGAAPAATGLTAEQKGVGSARKTVLRFVNTPVVLADEAGVTAHGSLKVYDMPAGAIQFLGASADLTVTTSSAGVDDDAAGDFGLGTVAADNDATPLATTEQNLIANTPITFVGGSEDIGAHASLVAAAFDGTTTPMDVYVNFLIDDADQDVTGTPCNLILNGTITLHWMNLGDY